MCGRYLFFSAEEIVELHQLHREINERYRNTPLLQAMSSGEIFPTNIAPTLVWEQNKARAALMQWGFPKWQGKGVIINARAESALEKKTFRQALLQQRCIVPTTGFFEWRLAEGAKKKTKYLFRPANGQVLYLAGLYHKLTARQTAYHAYVILTTAANPSVAPYHHRMPLLLTAAQCHKWLSETSFALAHLQTPCRTLLTAQPTPTEEDSSARLF